MYLTKETDFIADYRKIICIMINDMWRHVVVVTTTAQLHSTKHELRFSLDSNPARGVSEIRDGEDL